MRMSTRRPRWVLMRGCGERLSRRCSPQPTTSNRYRVASGRSWQARRYSTRPRHCMWEWPNYPQYYIPLADVRQTRTGRSADRRQVSGPPLPNTSSDSSHCPVARGARIEGEQTMLADGIPADEVAVHIQTSTEIEESSRKLGLTPPQRVRRGYVCGSKRLPSTQLVERRASLRS